MEILNFHGKIILIFYRLNFCPKFKSFFFSSENSDFFQVFHICWPVYDDYGSVTETAHWSFICGNGTIFDQQTLVCNYPQDSLPCDQAEAFYNLVEFGKIDSDY